jgi:hypothetical protein
MIEQAYDTILGILYNDLPKKEISAGKFLPTIYDKPVDGWYFGNKTIIPNSDVPALSIHSSSMSPKFKAYQTRQEEYKFTINCYAQSNSKELSERSILEFTRLVNEAMRKHRYIWVCTLCPFTGNQILSPEYYLNQPDINEVLLPYLADVNLNIQDSWNVTSAHLPLPEIPRSRLSAMAFMLFWNDVQLAYNNYYNWTSVPSESKLKISMSTLPVTYNQEAIFNNIVNMQLFLRKPIRLLFDVVANDIKPTDNGEQKALLYGSSFEIQAKELYKEIEFGPDNVTVLSSTPK